MIEFQDALKKSRAYNLIKHDIDTGNLSHAYMVISPDVFAVQNLFRLIACAVYCKDACTTCPVCKKVLNGNHADVKFINEDGKKIKVEDVAALIEDTETKPFESDNKLYFVNYADKMNPAAQNKLLKTLEEPQKAVSIFLGVGSESAILDTVKSRTKKITLDRFSAGDIKDALLSSGVADGNATIAAACADGSGRVHDKVRLALVQDGDDQFMCKRHIRDSSCIFLVAEISQRPAARDALKRDGEHDAVAGDVDKQAALGCLEELALLTGARHTRHDGLVCRFEPIEREVFAARCPHTEVREDHVQAAGGIEILHDLCLAAVGDADDTVQLHLRPPPRVR